LVLKFRVDGLCQGQGALVGGRGLFLSTHKL
jgi:hypothetical protein